MRTLAFLTFFVATIGHLGQAQEAQEWKEYSEGETLFALKVQPTLQAKCLACHGRDEDAIESGFEMTSREAMLRGGDSGDVALHPGNRKASWIFESATWEHEYLQMPPKENDRLQPEDLEALGKWIDLGAPWPDEETIAKIREEMDSGVSVATSGGLDENWDNRNYEPENLWAYRPLRLQAPAHQTSFAANNTIDLYINSRLQELGFKPAPRASRRALIRRLYFDVTGLPPTPAQVAVFLSDPAEDEIAWQALVDRVLSSPHAGEKAATHWLDVVRYADSAGFSNDYQRPNAWRYRDYVARVFNEDRPLDRFIREQIAGDEIDDSNPENLIATGMLRMGPWEHTGMSVAKVTRQQFLDDITDLIGQAFLAHPLQCARCHDHKFDPIPTRDYYRIQAVFATTQFADRDADFLDSENKNLFAQQTSYLKRRIRVFSELKKQISQKAQKYAKQWYAERGLKYGTRQAKQKAGVPVEQIAPKNVGFTPQDFGTERIAAKYVNRHSWELDRYSPIALSVFSGPNQSVRAGQRIQVDVEKLKQSNSTPEPTTILSGGDVFSPAAMVTPGNLSVLSGILGLDVQKESTITTSVGGRRLDFANWLVDPKRNPLTPRVMANRIWQSHFGKGIVKTPNNFGTASAKPSHPALLDYLAQRLIDSEWSSKSLHREILLSQAYCRSTSLADPDAQSDLEQRDPLATSYATFQIRRLGAEELHDSILEISGLLNHEIGGVPIRPNINPEVAAQPRQIMGSYAPIYQASPLPKDRNRRSIYALRLRTLRDPMLEVFNQPSSDLSCELRDNSTVAPQALTLFNSRFSYERALAFAERVLAESESSSEQGYSPQAIHYLFQLAYGREANASELAVCIDHWQKMTLQHEDIELETYRPPPEMQRSLISENTGESFTYTEVLEQNREYVPDADPSNANPRTRGLAEVCLVVLSSNELLYVP